VDDKEKINILLVDDNPSNLFALSALLDNAEYNLVKASSGKEALGSLLRDDFALVLLDVMMPEMDGFAVASAMKDREKTRHIPIIFVTAVAKDLKDIFQGYSVGAVDYIQKPLDAAIIRAKVSVFVDLFRKNRMVQRQAEIILNSERAQFLIGERAARKMAEEAEHRFRSLVNALDHAIIWESDIQLAKLTFVSERAEKLLGYRQEQWLSEPGFFMKRVPAEDQQTVYKTLEKVKTNTHFNEMGERCDHRLRGIDGTDRWFHTGIQAERDHHGNPIELRGLSVDINTLKGVEYALRDSEERLDLALNAGQMGMWDWNLITGTVVWSETLQRLWGYQPGEFSGKMDGFWARIHAHDHDRVTQALEDSFEPNRIYEAEFRVVWSDGSEHWIYSKGRAFRDSALKVIRMSGIAIEITERKQIEAALKESEERYRIVVEGILDHGIIHFDLRGRIIDWNSGAEKITEYRKEDAIGQPISILFLPEDLNSGIPSLEIDETTRNGVYKSERWYLRKNRTVFYASVVVNPLRKNGKIIGFVKVMKDETQRKAFDEEREELVKNLHAAVEAREEVVAVVAHDLKNPLSAASLGVGNLLSHAKKRGDQVIQQQIARVSRALNRAIKFTQDILDLSKVEAGRFSVESKSTDPTTLVNDSVDIFRALAAEKAIQINVEIESGLPQVLCDEERILQVFSNLLGNAIKFTPESGMIVVCVKNADHSVVFSIKDNGPGILEEEIPHIFNRYWQAKESSSRGVGLGLYIAKGIIEAHHGKIWVNSERGKGATFFFSLSAVEAAQGSLEQRKEIA
jgi:PAS domain S-box-containing protein